MRAAAWAAASLYRVRRDLRRCGLKAVVAPPPPVPRRASVGVSAVLAMTSPTCLERVLVTQRWLASYGECRAVVIGVPPGFPSGAASAHAWLEGSKEEGEAAEKYVELHRLPAPS